MELNNPQLIAYLHYVESLETHDDFDQWLIHGDFMELLSTRASLSDVEKQAGTLNEREGELLQELDARLAGVLSDEDVKQLQRESVELPVVEWWR